MREAERTYVQIYISCCYTPSKYISKFILNIFKEYFLSTRVTLPSLTAAALMGKTIVQGKVHQASVGKEGFMSSAANSFKIFISN